MPALKVLDLDVAISPDTPRVLLFLEAHDEETWKEGRDASNNGPELLAVESWTRHFEEAQMLEFAECGGGVDLDLVSSYNTRQQVIVCNTHLENRLLEDTVTVPDDELLQIRKVLSNGTEEGHTMLPEHANDGHGLEWRTDAFEDRQDGRGPSDMVCADGQQLEVGEARDERSDGRQVLQVGIMLVVLVTLYPE